MTLSPLQTRVLGVLQLGLPAVERPYAALAAEVGCDEATAIDTVRGLIADGAVRRLGLVVRHRRLGFDANAMVVWDVPDDDVDAVAARIADSGAVALCYRRPRVLPQWPYNLFCMFFGQDRDAVRQRLAALVDAEQLHGYRHEVLFSTRCFKQTGGRYV